MRKAIKRLKSAGGITVIYHIAEWGGNETAVEVHCDDDDISTKEWSISHISACGYIRAKVNGANKEKIYLVGIPIAWPSGREGGGKFRGRDI